MALTELLFQIERARIGVIELDASVRETHLATAKATDHPVEANAGGVSVISDHVHVDPMRITIEGVVSNTPAELVSVIQQGLEGSFDPAGDAHKQLLEDLLLGRLVEISTSLKVYDNIVLEQVSVDRRAATGNALHFTASGKQVSKVTTDTVAAIGSGSGAGSRSSSAPGKRTKNRGRKPPQAASDTDQSFLKKGVQKLRRN